MKNECKMHRALQWYSVCFDTFSSSLEIEGNVRAVKFHSNRTVGNQLLPFPSEMTAPIKKVRTFSFLKGVWGTIVISVICQLKPSFTYFL